MTAAFAITVCGVAMLPNNTTPAVAAAVPSFAAGSASVVEGDVGTRIVYMPVTLSDRASVQVSVDYSVTVATSVGTDFKFKSGKLTFKPAASSGLTNVRTFVPVTIYSDTTTEPTETFKLTLSNPTSGSAISNNTGIGTILDDDNGGSGVRVSANDASIYEGETGLNRPANLQP